MLLLPADRNISFTGTIVFHEKDSSQEFKINTVKHYSKEE